MERREGKDRGQMGTVSGSREEKGRGGGVRERGWRARTRRRVTGGRRGGRGGRLGAAAAGDRCLGGGGPRQT